MVKKRDLEATGSPERGSNLRKEGAYNNKEKGQRPSLINIWGIAGRQEIMEMRRLWQLRIPHT